MCGACNAVSALAIALAWKDALQVMDVIGAGERNRTPDRLITNQLLYLLSYASAGIKSTAVLLRSAIVPISATEVKLWSLFPQR